MRGLCSIKYMKKDDRVSGIALAVRPSGGRSLILDRNVRGMSYALSSNRDHIKKYTLLGGIQEAYIVSYMV